MMFKDRKLGFWLALAAAVIALLGGVAYLIIYSAGRDAVTGEYDRVFDRFTVLENADPAASRGLGLSFVREVVKQSNGRASAYVRNGVFTLIITF